MKKCKSKELGQLMRVSYGISSNPVSRFITATGIAILSAQAFAQQVEAPKVAAVDSSPIDVITVTARKASELVQDVPISVSTLRADQMVKENVTSIRDYFSKIPGLNLGRSGGRTDISLRGITTGTNTNPTMAVTIDDAPFGSSTSVGGGSMMMPDIDPFDLQRIEVLRGPQGTLYGASNLGGLIKYVSAPPNTSKLTGRVQVDGSKIAHGDSGFGVRAGINIPVIQDRLGLRFSVFNREDPGWLDNRTTHEEDVNRTVAKGGRVSAIWNLTDALSVRASAFHQRTQGKGTGSVAVNNDLKPLYGEFVAASMPGAFTYDRKIDFGDLGITYEMPWASLTASASFGHTQFEGPQDLSGVFGGLLENIFRAPFGALITSPYSVHKRSQEIRLDSPDDGRKLSWRVGVFNTSEDSFSGQLLTARDRNTAALIPSLPVLLDGKTSNDFEEVAAFGVLTYQFTPQFDVQGGFRYSRNEQDFRNHNGGILGGSPDFAGTSKESKTTYMFTPRYKPAKNLMLYATLSTGYRPGGPNSSISPGIPKSYEADSTRNYELGVKGQFWGNQLELDAAVFRIDWDNIQVALRDPASSFSYYANVGGAKSQGFELSGAFYPAPGWTLSGNVAFTDAVLTANLGALSNGKSGDRLPYVAKRTGALSLTREAKLLSGWTASAGLSANYVGDRDLAFGDSANDRRYNLPSFTTFALNAGISNKDWSINAFLRNLSDKRGLLSGGDSGQLVPSKAFPVEQGSLTTIAPRTVGVSVARSF